MKKTIHEEDNRGKRCLRCAAWFEYKRCSKKYCSDGCKQFAYIERKTKSDEAVIAPVKKTGFVKRIINWFRNK